MDNNLLETILMAATCVGLALWVLNSSIASLEKNQQLSDNYLTKRLEGRTPLAKEFLAYWRKRVLSMGEPLVFFGVVGLSVLAIFF